MSNIGDMLVDVKGLKSVHDSIKNTFSTKQELTNVDNKFSEVNSARKSGNGTTYDNLKARLDADKEAAEKDISKLKADLGDVNTAMVDRWGTSVIEASDFTVKTTYVHYTYNESERSITLTKTTTLQNNYQALSTPVDFLVGKLTVGKKYRMHYRADVLSGNPEIRMVIRKSDNTSALSPLIVEDGKDGYLDFVATADMSLVSIFITFDTAVGTCQIKYSDIYICESIGKIAVDDIARAEIVELVDATPLTMESGWIAVNTGIGTVVDTTDITETENYMHCIVECAEGDRFLVSGTGGIAPRLWCFLDEDKKIISVSDASLTAENLILTAPEDAAYLIVQSNDKTKTSYNGVPLNIKVDGMEGDIATTVSTVESITDSTLGASLVKASDFTVRTKNIQYTYDGIEQSVTLISSNTQNNYQALSTPVDFLVGKLTVGKTYRLHYRADIISGVPEIRMAIRKSNNSSALPPLILSDGVDGYVDFEATADMSLVSVFITFDTEIAPCQVKYSEIYLCEINGKTAVDHTARMEVTDVRAKLAETNVYKHTILRMLASMTYKTSDASAAMYRELFSMLRSLKDDVALGAFPAFSATGAKQGACTDGKYIYQTSGDKWTYTYMSIIKYDIDAEEIVSTTTFNGTPNFGHANDMTYDPVTGYLYVCTMLTDGSVIRIDSKDMSYVDTIYLVDELGEPYKVWQLAFDRVTRKLIVAVNTEYRIYDPDGTYIGAVPLASPLEATAQGMETDGVYIYRVTYEPSYLDVCSMDGTRIESYELPTTAEPETIMYDWAGNYYMTRHGTEDGQFYVIDFME